MSRLGALPLAGNEQILVLVKSYPWGLLVEYTGPSIAALLEAGCLSPMMADQLKVNSTGRSRKDEHGDVFSKKTRRLKGCPERLEICRYIKSGDARQLPGVAAWLDALNDDEDEPVSPRDARVALAGSANTKTRDRRVGRLQRQVKWSVAGPIILVDWIGLLRQRMVAQS